MAVPTVAESVTACPAEIVPADADSLAVVPSRTLTLIGDETLPVKMSAPPNVAVIEWFPIPNELVSSRAWPFGSILTVPTRVLPSRKVTEPTGLAVPASGVISAVSEICSPTTADVSDTPTVIFVATLAGVTVSVSDAEEPR